MVLFHICVGKKLCQNAWHLRGRELRALNCRFFGRYNSLLSGVGKANLNPFEEDQYLSFAADLSFHQGKDLAALLGAQGASAMEQTSPQRSCGS